MYFIINNAIINTHSKQDQKCTEINKYNIFTKPRICVKINLFIHI